MADTRVSRGIWRTRYGWRLYTRIDGTLRPKRIHDPEHRKTLPELKIERDKWKVQAHGKTTMPDGDKEASTFARDVADDYLPAVRSMPTFTDRRHHMAEWVVEFGDRARDTVTPLEVRKVLERRRTTLAASSCNKRRTALMHFYTVLNGKSGYNPVRDVPKYQEDEAPHDHPIGTLYRILACMRPSATRARLRVFLWTGWPHKQLKQLLPEHIDWKAERAYVTRRRKGKGHAAVWLPLLPGAVVALKDLARWTGFGPFSNPSLRKSLVLAVKKYNAHRRRFKHPPITVRPYDFRHSFGTWVADHLEDDRVLQELMLHSKREQSLRYTRRATARRLERGIAHLREVTTRGNQNAQTESKPVKTSTTQTRRQRTKPEKRWRGRRGSNPRPPA